MSSRAAYRRSCRGCAWHRNETRDEHHATVDPDRPRPDGLAGGRCGVAADLLHAFPLTADMWRPQLEQVPQGWRFIAPDLRGFGRAQSLPPKGGRQITMDDYAQDVCALMDGLKIGEAVIGGLSMGGYVAFALHRQSPSRFTGLVLADTRSQADTPLGRDGRAR